MSIQRFPARYYNLTIEEAERFYNHPVDRSGDCHLWVGPRTKEVVPSYGTFGVTRDGKNVALRVNRLIYIMQGGDPDVEVVRHTCDNPPCMNPQHLIGGTHAENHQDAIDRDRAVVNGVSVNTWRMMAEVGRETGMWPCFRCGATKCEDQFSPFNKAGKAAGRGIQAWCRQCMNEVRAAKPDRQKKTEEVEAA